MELAETIETLNAQLIDLYGIDTVTGRPMFRIVWSEDQYEKRLVDTLDSGIILAHPVVREVPKYRTLIKDKYVLERLVVIPEVNAKDLPATKLSYEPLWTFMDGQGNYLPPTIVATQFIIDTLYAALGKVSLAKYRDPDSGLNKEELIEKKLAQIQQMELELFGNETETGDALAYGEGIVVPNNYHPTKES